MVWSRAGWAGSQRYPIAVGRRAAERLGRPRRVDPRRTVVGHERRAVPRADIGGFYGSAQPLGRAFRALAAGGGVQLARAPPRHRRARAVGVRRRGRGDRRKWLAFRYRLIPYLAVGDRAMRRTTGLPVMRAMPLAFPGNALVRDLRDAVHVRRRAAGRADRRAPGGEVEIALPPGAWYDLNSRQRYRGPAACCATRRRSTSSRCSAAKATRCRSAARSSTPARSMLRSRSSSSGCSARPRSRSTASRRLASRPAPTDDRDPRGARTQGRVVGDAATSRATQRLSRDRSDDTAAPRAAARRSP